MFSFYDYTEIVQALRRLANLEQEHETDFAESLKALRTPLQGMFSSLGHDELNEVRATPTFIKLRRYGQLMMNAVSDLADYSGILCRNF